ncbi:MAG TPA: TetR/AcrR family transcriptional regulator [Microbacteriaceae bacterium]
MAHDHVDSDQPMIGDHDRRDTVLESALGTFARYGYRKTSMEEVARAAQISRPGLYFLFSSKETLFRAAVERTLQRDIEAVASALAETERPFRDRLLAAFDHWAGRYAGPLTRDVMVVIDDNPELLGTIVQTMPQRFEELIIEAIEATANTEAARRMSQTLISTSIGVKHQVGERREYRDRMAVAIALVVP